MKKQPVAIGYLERFAADFERENIKANNIELRPSATEKNGMDIAVVGSGPAGLSFAGDMIKKGYNVTVYEALHESEVCLSTAYPNSVYQTLLLKLR